MRLRFGNPKRAVAAKRAIQRAEYSFGTIESSLRSWWENRWNQPSRGNPLWEDVPLMDHLESFTEYFLAKGKRVVLEEKSGSALISVEDQEKQEDDFDPDAPVVTGDEEIDRLERMIAMGLDPFEDSADG